MKEELVCTTQRFLLGVSPVRFSLKRNQMRWPVFMMCIGVPIVQGVTVHWIVDIEVRKEHEKGELGCCLPFAVCCSLLLYYTVERSTQRRGTCIAIKVIFDTLGIRLLKLLPVCRVE